MLRKEYWERAGELIEFCTDEELKVLSQQSIKALNKRMSDFLNKFDASESHKEKVAKRKAKEKAIKKNVRSANV